MITVTYTNPNKPKPSHQTNSTYYNYDRHTEHSDHYYEYFAKKRDIDVTEFRRRDDVFRKESKGVNWVPYDIVYPRDYGDYEKLGQCKVSKVFKTYCDPDAKWPEDGSRPYVIEVRSMKNNGIWNTTGTYFQRVPPVKPANWDVQTTEVKAANEE